MPLSVVMASVLTLMTLVSCLVVMAAVTEEPGNRSLWVPVTLIVTGKVELPEELSEELATTPTDVTVP